MGTCDASDGSESNLITLVSFLGAHSGLPPLKFMAMGCFLVGVSFQPAFLLTESVAYGYPASRGHIHIASDDIYAHPDFYAGFFSQ